MASDTQIRLKRFYLSALLILAAASTASLLVTLYILSLSDSDAYRINIAGKQRMLSQKIALHSSTSNTDKGLGILTSAINTFEKNHSELTGTNSQFGALSDKLSNQYFSGTPSLDQRVKSYVKDARLISQSNFQGNSNEIFTPTRTESLLKDLDAIVAQMELEASQKLETLSFVLWLVWLATLLILSAQGLLIFRPMEKSIKKSYKKVKKQIEIAKEERRKAEKILREKQVLVSNLSHELRTPVNIISACFKQLKDQFNGESKIMIDYAFSATERMNVLLSQFFDIQEIDNDNLKLNIEPQSLKKVLLPVINYFIQVSNSKSIGYEVEGFSDISHYQVELDYYRVQEILFSILDNAFKFTQQGKVRLSFEAEVTEECLELSCVVKDTGVGIESDEQPRVFERFYRSDKHLVHNEDGLGIGLYLTQQLVDKMEGTINVSSVPNSGTEVVVQISFSRVCSNETAEGENSEERLDNAIDQSAHPLKALVVDDNAVNTMILKTMLEDLDFHVATAADGQLAIEACRSINFDIVFMDLKMPKVDGYSATKALRNELKITNPIIAVSANSTQPDKDDAFRAGVDYFISKPIDKDIVQSVVHTYLKVAV
ncbi:response regulator [Pleionea sediminis]|uniref:response regulator n=1 Tax=Pleionea sediminis TaxID=2569479 RepID=UPI0013DDD5F6|nr:response regulator [Pleionea sediminis]